MITRRTSPLSRNMEKTSNDPPASRRHVLATDLDGTLIPLPNHRQNSVDLDTLADQIRKHNVTLIYITGRHFSSARDAMELHHLPEPDWLIADVGTSVFQRTAIGQFAPVEAYQQHLNRIIARLPIRILREQLTSVHGLHLQEQEKQGRFKLSYYTDADCLDRLAEEIRQRIDQLHAPWSVIPSVDPFNGDGLIDLLPKNVSKAHALEWWVRDADLHRDAIVFAGDSGNDLAGLTAGCCAIVVGNAHRSIAKQAWESHRREGWTNRLYLAQGEATSGVLQGCRWFGLAEPDPHPIHRLGATPVTDSCTWFRVWAPNRTTVSVEVDDGHSTMRQGLILHEDGYFCGHISPAAPGSRYRCLLNDELPRPDPASAFQPDGVHGPSQIVDHTAFPWTDQQWTGVQKRDLVIYELHVGAFTAEGTFRAAIERIPDLCELGVTAVELMPVAQSPGRWNWGYDGVNLFAPRNTYGEPDDFRALVDACHNAGLAVILDVVYNHIGPEGNYLADFGPYFSVRHQTPWGDAFNFDGQQSGDVRRFVVENALYWLDTYHLDGLRLDAVHFMQDSSDVTILDELRGAVAKYAQSAGRAVHLIAESNVYDSSLLREHHHHPPCDAIWCDCLMHSIYAQALPDLQLTRREYRSPRDLVDALKYGCVFESRNHASVRISGHQRGTRSSAERTHVESFVIALQTHDAVGNHPLGRRIHQLTSKEFQKAAAALTLLYPGIPLLFMGEECAIETTFPFFVDFEDPQLQQVVTEGRAAEYPHDSHMTTRSASDTELFVQAKCHDHRLHDPTVFQWYRDLISFRRQGIAEGWLTGERLSVSHIEALQVFAMHFACDDGRQVTVLTRLADRDQPAFVSVATAGSVVLSSEPHPVIVEAHVELGRNHTVISRS